LFDVPNKLLGSLSVGVYAVKMAKGGKVWSLINRLWLKNGELEGLSRSAHIMANFS
jgi:hypothetical protein